MEGARRGEVAPAQGGTLDGSGARRGRSSTPGSGQIVELDGREGHRTRTAFREDRARDRTLPVAGYFRYPSHLNQLDDEPDAIASDLRELLKQPTQVVEWKGGRPPQPTLHILCRKRGRPPFPTA